MTIAEASRVTGVAANTLRYYERIGLVRPVPRTESGIRDYQEENIANIEFVKRMREAGMPVESLIEYMRLFQAGDISVGARKELLQEQLQELLEKRAEMDRTIDKLQFKIAQYENIILASEKKMNDKAYPKIDCDINV